jgi:PAS domain-containing protein
MVIECACVRVLSYRSCVRRASLSIICIVNEFALHMTASARRPNDQLEHDLLVEWLEQARVGLVVLDSGGKVVMLNSAACSKLGVDALSVLHGPVANLVQHTAADLDRLAQ